MAEFSVVGGGIAGLVVARRLALAGREVVLHEASDRLGGTVAGHVVGGLELDAGAESFATRGGTVEGLARELGLGDAVVSPAPLVAWLLPPAVSTLTPAGAEPAYHLAPRERASWFGSARSKAILAIGLVVAVAGVVIFVLGHVAGAFVCLVGLIAVWLHSLEVRVDADGVTAHFGPVAWPRVRVPLAGIAAVEAQGYAGYSEIEIFSNDWWQKPMDDVLRTCIARHKTVV